MDDVRIIGSRRAYEFAPDDIRLSTLSLPSVVERIRQAFRFQDATIGTPVATFGPVPQTLPPGLTFSLGQVEAPGGAEVLIRVVNFEPRRIVVDVAGPSAAIDVVFERIRESLDGLTSGDGWPALGEPTGTLDQSTITARLSFAPDELMPPRLRSVFATAMGVQANGQVEAIVPTLIVQRAPRDGEYPGVGPSSVDAFQLAVRAGARPADRVYFSVAPLDSDRHRRYLERLEEAVVGTAR